MPVGRRLTDPSGELDSTWRSMHPREGATRSRYSVLLYNLRAFFTPTDGTRPERVFDGRTLHLDIALGLQPFTVCIHQPLLWKSGLSQKLIVGRIVGASPRHRSVLLLLVSLCVTQMAG